MSFAARIGDSTADGAITGVGEPTVLIGGMPAAVVGDIGTPISGNIPGPYIMGSFTVFIGGKPALRVGDMCSNGTSVIILGATNVLIG
ncbi:MAG TPA: PAAR domain-containing protein [Edaphocola sp.]|nr:PAAR domain-containing protein [Edaphocola sp.]